MAIPFVATGKTNPNDSEIPMQYYPRAVHSGTIELDDLADQISIKSTVSPADCYAVIVSLVNEISLSLEEGKIVRLGHLGSFQVSIKGTASNSSVEVKPQNVKSSSIIYRPGSRLKKMLGNLTFYRKKE
jgi:predicted histone-like DNA-binding protein